MFYTIKKNIDGNTLQTEGIQITLYFI